MIYDTLRIFSIYYTTQPYKKQSLFREEGGIDTFWIEKYHLRGLFKNNLYLTPLTFLALYSIVCLALRCIEC